MSIDGVGRPGLRDRREAVACLCDNESRREGMPMVDIAKQVAHWRDGALEDWQVAEVFQWLTRQL